MTTSDLNLNTAGTQNQSAKYFILAMLTVIYSLNFLDRQLLAILAEPIKQDLGLSDTQLGMLTGLVFAIFYTMLGVPLAWVAAALVPRATGRRRCAARGSRRVRADDSALEGADRGRRAGARCPSGGRHPPSVPALPLPPRSRSRRVTCASGRCSPHGRLRACCFCLPLPVVPTTDRPPHRMWNLLRIR